jgi:hypothetical protein
MSVKAMAIERAAAPRRASWLDTLARRAVLAWLVRTEAACV